ncbi:hypothetical protein [Streptomyces cinereoruber]|uniref:hypothetical protein n=1 Tax=Streptomyces cinereoruber TaxID=67260 RepID=UPI00362685D3
MQRQRALRQLDLAPYEIRHLLRYVLQHGEAARPLVRLQHRQRGRRMLAPDGITTNGTESNG